MTFLQNKHVQDLSWMTAPWTLLTVVLCICTTLASGQDASDENKSREQIKSLYGEGKLNEALDCALKLRSTCVRRYGSGNTNSAASFDILGLIYNDLGEYSTSVEFYKAARKFWKEALGKTSAGIEGSRNNLGLLYTRLGDYSEADNQFEKAWKGRRKLHGDSHPDTLICLYNRAVLHERAGDYSRSRKWLEALAKEFKLKGEDKLSELGAKIAGLRGEYEVLGKCGKAEAPALGMLARVYDEPDGTNVATALTWYWDAKSLERNGDYSLAEAAYQHSLRLIEQALGQEHYHVGDILHDFAEFYVEQGDLDKAEVLHLRALKIRESSAAAEPAHLGISLSNFASLCQRLTNSERALLLYGRALELEEKALGSNHLATGTTLSRLASIYENAGAWAKVELPLRQATRVFDHELLKEHPQSVAARIRQAWMFLRLGETNLARTVADIVIGTLFSDLRMESEFPFATRTFWHGMYSNFGDSQQQGEMRRLESALRLHDRHLSASFKNLGLLQIDLGRKDLAFEMARSAQEVELRALVAALGLSSERWRLQTHAELNPHFLFASLSRPAELAASLLHFKGAVLDSLVEDQLATNALSGKNPFQEEMEAKSQRIERLVLDWRGDEEEGGKRSKAISQQMRNEVLQFRQLQWGRLTLRESNREPVALATRLAVGVSVEQLKSNLPPRSALVEFIRFPYYYGTNTWQIQYGAVVIPSAGDVKWAALGDAASIDEAIVRFQDLMRSTNQPVRFVETLRSLYRRVWAPVQDLLPDGTECAILSPDGELSFVSFASLLAPDDRFVGEKHTIRYVASGRDLLREHKSVPAQDMVVFAAPEFSRRTKQPLPASPAAWSATRNGGDIESIRLTDLPGTGVEAKLLAERAREWNWPIAVYLGDQSTESRLRGIAHPHILHLATHGFFLPKGDPDQLQFDNDQRGVGAILPRPSPQQDSGPAGSPDKPVKYMRGKVVLQNPMRRSGLALTGARDTLAAWKHQEVPNPVDDGIVTAEEVGNLDLHGTWLVTLAACDTGIGESRSGEGVMGLRRGFVQAGAKNLLLTLWAVSDQATADFMAEFYQRIHRVHDASTALAEVQRDWLVRLRKESDIQTAVRLAGPFIISFQGNIATSTDAPKQQ